MNWTKELPPEAAVALKAETQGETIRWAGKPDPRQAFAGGTSAWLMGIPWCALTFTIFGILVASVLSGKPPKGGVTPGLGLMMLAMLIFVAGFVLVGIGMMAVPFLAWWKARRTIYAITDRRILRLVSGKTKEVMTVTPDKILNMTRRERHDGTGTLRLVTGFKRDSDGDIGTVTEELLAVPNVREAERIISSMQASAAA